MRLITLKFHWLAINPGFGDFAAALFWRNPA